MNLKILSWNIWRGKYLDQVIELLQAESPDVIGLQEVIEFQEDGVKRNQAYEIASKLGYHVAYYKAVTGNKPDRTYDLGNAILTKAKVTSSAYHFLSSPDLYQQSSETEPRIAIIIQIESDNEAPRTNSPRFLSENASFQSLHPWTDSPRISAYENKTLTIINTHLAYSHQLEFSQTRDLQITELLKFIKRKDTILIGDFNSDATGRDLNRIEQAIPNADQNPTQPTWSVFPTNYKGFEVQGLKYRIDHIFVSDNIKVRDFRIIKTKASDHLPICAVLELVK